ncbi:hypothetical protein H8D83_00865 [Candidatus Woesearchaeota archaeon]|nr:hypothetical protein [Candidatus Woesearchaeota archaeon]MBL7050703.1 hypothetical protein [Candidatus Woesearchaeota archaeon]
MHPYKGKFIIIDGLDGIGKGVIIKALEEIENKTKKVFNLIDFWKKHKTHPDYELLKPYDTIISSEPTYAEKGLEIRNKIIAKGTTHSALDAAKAYSQDRLILYNKIILKALKDGKTIIQDRSVCSSLVYQRTQSDNTLSITQLTNLEGNKLALNNSPNLLIIPTIKNPEELMARLSNRTKQDNCIFENINFQLKLKPIYESQELKQLFESRNTIVKYLDASLSIKETQEQAINIYKEFLNNQ